MTPLNSSDIGELVLSGKPGLQKFHDSEEVVVLWYQSSTPAICQVALRPCNNYALKFKQIMLPNRGYFHQSAFPDGVHLASARRVESLVCQYVRDNLTEHLLPDLIQVISEYWDWTNNLPSWKEAESIHLASLHKMESLSQRVVDKHLTCLKSAGTTIVGSDWKALQSLEKLMPQATPVEPNFSMIQIQGSDQKKSPAQARLQLAIEESDLVHPQPQDPDQGPSKQVGQLTKSHAQQVLVPVSPKQVSPAVLKAATANHSWMRTAVKVVLIAIVIMASTRVIKKFW